jgi:DNA-binding CsgD family transcriptional regulator
MRLVGRERETDAALRALRSPGSRTVLITGPAGIGKTALFDEVLRRIADTHVVVAARAVAAESHLAFAALGTLLSGHLDGLTQLPTPQAHALEVALAMREPDGAPAQDLAIGWAVTGLLEGLSEQGRPVVLAVDDIRELDVPSANALAFACRRLVGGRICAVMTTRTGELPILLAALPTGRLDLGLAGLDAPSIGSLLAERLGVPIADARLASIMGVARGNPLASVELARLATSSPGSPNLSDTTSLLRTRVAELAPPARQLLLLMAVNGPLAVATAEQLTGADELATAVAEAVDRQLVIVDEDRRILFVHPLVATSVQDLATPAERRHAHAGLAACEQLDPEQRVRHAAHAAILPDDEIAGRLESAAQQAAARGAAWTAGELAEWACRLTPELRRDERVRRGMRAARSYFSACAPDRAAPVLDLVEAEATASERANISVLRAGLAGSYFPDVRVHLESALTYAEPGSRIHVRALLDYSWALCSSAGMTAAAEPAQAAARAAQAAGMLDVALQALNIVWIAQAHGLDGDAEATYEQILGLRGDLFRQARPAGPSSMCMTPMLRARSRGDHDQAIALAEALIVSASGFGDYRLVYWYKTYLLEALVGAGAAAAASVVARDLAAYEGLVPGFRGSSQSLALFHAHTGDLDSAAECLRRGIELSQRNNDRISQAECLSVQGFAELSRGRAEPALEALRQVRSIANKHGIVNPGALLWHVDYVEAAVELGLVDEARTVVDELAGLAGATGQTRLTAWSSYCDSLLVAATGDLPAAAAILRSLENEGGLSRFERGRVRLRLGIVLRRSKRRAEASAALEAASAFFGDLANPLWLAKVGVEQARLGNRPRHDHPRTALTPTETRLAAMVGQGLTNRQVAAAMHLTIKSVEASLTAIYRKLGVQSRTQLARIILTPPD